MFFSLAKMVGTFLFKEFATCDLCLSKTEVRMYVFLVFFATRVGVYDLGTTYQKYLLETIDILYYFFNFSLGSKTMETSYDPEVNANNPCTSPILIPRENMGARGVFIHPCDRCPGLNEQCWITCIGLRRTITFHFSRPVIPKL